MTESFYDILGVPADADTDAIERAYRQRIKETHPDVNDDPDASEETARIVEAKDVLTDEAERARYDRIGHEAYVRSAGADSTGEGANEDEPASSRAAADATASASSSDGPTDAGASAEERRRRERRAARDVDFGAESTASAAGEKEPGSGRATAGGSARSSTVNREPPSWSDTSDGWAARAPTNAPPGLATHVLEALLEAPATAIVTFLLYPLLVLGAFFPPFPLIVNVIVGACLLAMIAAAQSVPGLGIAVYGAWSILGAIGLVATGHSPFAPLGLLVLGTTWLPLGFSLLTYQVLDS